MCDIDHNLIVMSIQKQYVDIVISEYRNDIFI